MGKNRKRDRKSSGKVQKSLNDVNKQSKMREESTKLLQKSNSESKKDNPHESTKDMTKNKNNDKKDENLKETDVNISSNSSSEKEVSNSQKNKSITGIVLVMIVKNESRIIARCLEKAKPIIDGVCITDTGSTDNCVECIQSWCKKNKIASAVPTSEFKNFGWARTKSFLNARHHFPNASYYLLLDADFELVVHPDWNPSELTADGYKIYQQTSISRYQNIRLLKADKPWRCIGVTHEYWECKNGKLGIHHSIEIDDKDDGGCKADKYERDKRLLLEGIADKNTPNDLRGRYRFYLAQTHLCLKEYDAGIDEYQKRIDIGGWNEEIWYSQYQIGKAYFDSNRPEMGVTAMLKAWDMRPRRAEPILQLSRYYRGKAMNQVAFLFAKKAYDNGYPIGDSLFVDTPTYKYMIDFELSITAFYVGKKELACQAHRRLKHVLNDLPPWIQSAIENNDKFYKC